MKKLLTSLLACCMVFSVLAVTGCSKDKDKDKKADDKKEEKKEDKK